MEIIRHQINRDLEILEDTQLKGTIVGSTTVHPNIEFKLDGTVTGSVIVRENGKVIIRGTVLKGLVNYGGDVEIYGVVRGKISNQGGNILIDEDAITDK
ncbi:hypothetical protein [Paenibacillus amylolyticus]|uniref:hypothetical protein n=1 Tax=Paenibacillus amylolyticus TaxID=1451 RepID=UPI00339A9105